MLIGVDYHRAFSKLHFLKERPVSVVNGSCTTVMEKQRDSIET